MPTVKSGTAALMSVSTDRLISRPGLFVVMTVSVAGLLVTLLTLFETRQE